MLPNSTLKFYVSYITFFLSMTSRRASPLFRSAKGARGARSRSEAQWAKTVDETRMGGRPWARARSRAARVSGVTTTFFGGGDFQVA